MEDSLDMSWFDQQEREEKIFRNVKTALPTEVSFFCIRVKDNEIAGIKRSKLKLTEGVLKTDDVKKELDNACEGKYKVVRDPLIYYYQSNIRDLVEGSLSEWGSFFSLEDDFSFEEGVAGLHCISPVLALIGEKESPTEEPCISREGESENEKESVQPSTDTQIDTDKTSTVDGEVIESKDVTEDEMQVKPEIDCEKENAEGEDPEENDDKENSVTENENRYLSHKRLTRRKINKAARIGTRKLRR